MKTKKNPSTPVTSILDPRYARHQVGHMAYYCLEPGCPDALWPSGYPRIVPREHFTEDGQCKRAAEAVEGS